MNLKSVFEIPVEIQEKIPAFHERLLQWYKIAGRDFDWRDLGRSPYEIIIAEVLLQRTTASKVADHYENFVDIYSSWEILAETNEDNLQSVLKPLGLWRQKSEVLISLARAMVKREGELPVTRDQLETLPGVGQYIASAIMLTVYEQPEPLLDINMARIIERYFGKRKLADIRYDPYLQSLSREIIKQGDYLTINWAMLDLGAMICKVKTPRCNECLLYSGCLYYQSLHKDDSN